MAVELTPEQLALALDRMDDPNNWGALPPAQPARFEHRVTILMNVSGGARPGERAVARGVCRVAGRSRVIQSSAVALAAESSPGMLSAARGGSRRSRA